VKLTRILPFAAVVALLSPALLAGGLEKYKTWPNSPQGYFLTKAERAEWKANVKTDADAEQFINKFVASRGPGFADMVADRAAAADKHLTVSGTLGSLTTRGKIAILLGPPTSFSIQERAVKGRMAYSAAAYGNIGDTGPSASEMNDAAIQSNMSASKVDDYAFTYKADLLPGKPAKDFLVVVEVNPQNGTDRIVDTRQAARLNELAEAAAEASLAKK
jgi:hypothetical protein